MPGNYTVPPPPPAQPLDLALDTQSGDPEADQMVASLFGGGNEPGPGPQPLQDVQQPAPPPQDQGDPEADAMLNDLMGEKPAKEPAPKTATKPADASNAVTRKKPLGKTLAGEKPGRKPPNQFWTGVDSAIGQAGQAIQGLPAPFGPAAQGMTQQANQSQAAQAANPWQHIASEAAGIPIGIAGLADAGLNTLSRTVYENDPKIRAIMKRGPTPFNLKGMVEGTGLGAIAAQSPASAGTGEAIGASTVPLSVPFAGKFVKAHPVMGHAAQGAAAGEVLGAVGSAGEQAKTGPVNLGKALVEGLPTATVGAGLGLAGGVVGEGVGKATPKPKAPAAPKAAPTVKLRDGSELTVSDAIKSMQDPATPPEVKVELQLATKELNQAARPAGRRAKRGEKKDTRSQDNRDEYNQIYQDSLGTVGPQAPEAYPDTRAPQQKANSFADEFFGDVAPAEPSQYPSAWEAMGKTRPAENFSYPDTRSQVQPQAPPQAKPGKPTAKAKPLTRQTVFDDMTANPSPPEIEALAMDAIKFAPSRAELDTVTNDAARMVSRNVKDPDLRKRMMGKLKDEYSNWNLREARENATVRGGGEELAAEQAKLDEKIATDQSELARRTTPDNFVDNPEINLFPNARNSIKIDMREPTKGKGQSGVLPREQGGYVTSEGDMAPSYTPHDSATDSGLAEEIARVEAMKPKTDLQSQDKADMLKTLIDEQGRRGYRKANGLEQDWPQEPSPGPEVASSETPAQRFTVQRTKGGSEVVDSTTGEVVSSNNNGLEANQRRAEELSKLQGDELETALRKGSKNMLNFKVGEPGVRSEIVARGQPLAAEHPQRADYEALADAKHNFDETRAKFFGAVDAYDALTNQKTPTKTSKVDAKYSDDVENFVQQVLKDGGAGELTIEVQNSKKIEPGDKPRFKRGMDEPEAYKLVEEASTAYQAAKNALVEARRPIKDDVLATGSTNIPHAKGEINVRPVPKQGTETAAIAAEMRGPLPDQEVLDRTITRVRTYHKEQASADYEAVATSTTPTVKRAPRGMRSQKGSVMLTNFRGKKAKTVAPTEPIDATEAALAKGAQEDPMIKDWANDGEKVKALITTKNSLDILKEAGEINFGDNDIVNLHSEVWRALSEEVNILRKVEKFDFENDLDLIESTRKMTPEEIWDGGPDGEILKFGPERLNALAQIAEIRQETAATLRDAAEHMLEPYGEKELMPNKVKTQYEVMDQMADAMDGTRKSGHTSELSLVNIMQRGLYDYIFRWNPRYHLLNLLDPLVVGSARVGIDKIAAAKWALQTDPTIRKFIKSLPSESLNQTARKEAQFQSRTPLGVEETIYGKTKRKIAGIQAKIPDLMPSERWGFEDAITAGLIQKGDLVYGKGKGLDYLRDLASDKLTPDQEVDAFMHSLEVADDISGAATLGLNKTAIQRAGYSNSFAQLVGQQTRVARMLRNLATTGAVGGIVTFAAANVLFGGRSVLPYETEILKGYPQLKPLIEKLEDILDWVPDHTTERIPIIGRDLSQKLRYSAAVPWAGGIGGNLLLETTMKFMRNWQGEKWDEVSKFALLMSISSALRGGGSEMEALIKNADALKEGDKKVYAFGMQAGGRPKGQSTFSKVTGQKFGMLNFLQESGLPGDNPKVGDWKKKELRK